MRSILLVALSATVLPAFAQSCFGHDYEFTVMTMGQDGQTELARGSKSKTFSASTAK